MTEDIPRWVKHRQLVWEPKMTQPGLDRAVVRLRTQL